MDTKILGDSIKGMLKSKTFWFNVASAGVEISGALTNVVPAGTALLFVNTVNIVLRAITSQSLAAKGDTTQG